MNKVNLMVAAVIALFGSSALAEQYYCPPVQPPMVVAKSCSCERSGDSNYIFVVRLSVLVSNGTLNSITAARFDRGGSDQNSRECQAFVETAAICSN